MYIDIMSRKKQALSAFSKISVVRPKTLGAGKFTCVGQSRRLLFADFRGFGPNRHLAFGLHDSRWVGSSVGRAAAF